jgi:hypothetical protein
LVCFVASRSSFDRIGSVGILAAAERVVADFELELDRSKSDGQSILMVER